MRLVVILILLVIPMVAAKAQQKIFATREGAIQGYDPVAYFLESKPVKGDPKFTFQWAGASWYFTSQNNLDLFKSSPEKYAPQYGGFCAYGASDGAGHKATTSPDAWTIVDGKLYLNYNTDVKKLWSADRAERIKMADDNWIRLQNLKE